MKKSQAGVSLIIVVFIIVALSILASSLVQLLTASSDSVAREVLSARALMAAESGAQRLLNDIYVNGQGACVNSNYSFSALSGCGNVAFTCASVQVPAVSGDIYYTIESTGVCGPAGDQASRTIEVQAKNI